MHGAQESRPRARSPFVAAFLSLLFPGLGHAYAGAYQRALGFAAPLILIGALLAGIFLRMDGPQLLSFGLQGWVLPAVFAANLVLLVYRLVAIVDAYRVAAYLNAYESSGGGRLGRPRLVFNPVSVAGLLAVILVMAGGHVVLARYDLLANDVLHDPCIFTSNDTSSADLNCDDQPSDSPGASPSDSGPTDAPEDSGEPTLTPPPVQGSDLPNVSIPPWDGTDRLNILLIGSDQRPNENTYNTDTLIVVSIDPNTKQVAMFSLPRDSTDLPLPPGTPLARAYGGIYPAKINSLFTAVRNRGDLVPGTSKTRGYNALKSVLGNLYQLDIKYFIEVNFTGFKRVVDALGGVTINVQAPVIDEGYPADTGRHQRIYIPAGIQHMTGAQALVYARSRHGSDDFDRGYRQQRVLTSLREQANISTLFPKIPALYQALRSTVKTDIPLDQLSKLAGLADQIDTQNIRSYVFSFPRYGTQILAPIYKYLPDVTKIRVAVANAFKVDPALEDTRAALGDENGTIWVLNGNGQDGQASSIAGYLEYYGLTASAPTRRPDQSGLAQTRIVVYNGREAQLSQTIEFLQKKFRVQVELKSEPSIPVDIIITTGQNTPAFAPPPAS
jgi:polyisoprenyl-teichoic acid--peptidoglycan teichoic acid transferase